MQMDRRKTRHLVWAAVLALVLTLVGYDLTRRPEQEEQRTFRFVDALSAATPSGSSVVGLIASDYERLERPVPRDEELSVAQVEEMVRYAVAMAGGLYSRIPPDAEWILVKPNIVELKPRGSGVITDWRVVRALLKIVHEVVPEARITIAEGGAWVPADRQDIASRLFGAEVGDGFAIAGYAQLLDDPELDGIDLDIVDLNFDETAEVYVPDGGYVFEQYHVPLTVLECDFLISVPVLKVIGSVGMTNCMKNFVGIAPGMIYGWPKMQGFPPGGPNPGLPHAPGILDEVIVDLASLAEGDFTVVDAVVGMERAKTDEDGGRPVRLNTVLAGADLVAADAVSALLIGMNPADIEYLTLAAYKGLGQYNPASIKVKGSSLEQASVRFEKYPAQGSFRGEHGHYGQGCRTWLLQGPFERSALEKGEAPVDPESPGARPGAHGWSQPVYFHDDLIDLDRYYDDPFDCVVYAYAEFTAPSEQQAELWLGSDEDLSVWLNGELVYEHVGRRRHRLPNDRQLVSIRADTNTVLVRAAQTRSRFDFSLNVCEPEPDPRYDGNRVQGVEFFVPAPAKVAAATEELMFQTTEAGELPADAVVLQEAHWVRHFDVLVGALEGCLRHADVNLEPQELMGISGHAFHLCIADSVALDGAQRVELETMLPLYSNLGYEFRHFSISGESPGFADAQVAAWDTMRRSIDAGRPAVCRFGAFYWLVRGYHAKGERCYVSGFMGDARPVELNELGREEHGLAGLDVLTLGERRPVTPRAAAQAAIRFAVADAHRPEEGRYHTGLSAYEQWASDVAAGRLEHDFGLRIAAAVALERRQHAAPYLHQIASLFPDAAAYLETAASRYKLEVEHLESIAALFPLMGGGGSADLEDPAVRRRIADLIRQAGKQEAEAVASLEQAVSLLE